MNCPKCLGKTLVTDSRTPDSSNNRHIANYGDKVIGWWCSDYRVRLRSCKRCRMTFRTVEMSVEDLIGALEDNTKKQGER